MDPLNKTYTLYKTFTLPTWPAQHFHDFLTSLLTALIVVKIFISRGIIYQGQYMRYYLDHKSVLTDNSLIVI